MLYIRNHRTSCHSTLSASHLHIPARMLLAPTVHSAYTACCRSYRRIHTLIKSIPVQPEGTFHTFPPHINQLQKNTGRQDSCTVYADLPDTTHVLASRLRFSWGLKSAAQYWLSSCAYMLCLPVIWKPHLSLTCTRNRQ